MKPFVRSDRVSGQIQRVLSELLQKDIKDPRLEKVTITAVKLTRDLRFARVYFTAGSALNIEDTAQGFQSALGFIKRTLANRLGLRYMPDLKFFYDETVEYGAHINTVLKSLRIKDETDSDTPESL